MTSRTASVVVIGGAPSAAASPITSPGAASATSSCWSARRSAAAPRARPPGGIRAQFGTEPEIRFSPRGAARCSRPSSEEFEAIPASSGSAISSSSPSPRRPPGFESAHRAPAAPRRRRPRDHAQGGPGHRPALHVDDLSPPCGAAGRRRRAGRGDGRFRPAARAELGARIVEGVETTGSRWTGAACAGVTTSDGRDRRAGGRQRGAGPAAARVGRLAGARRCRCTRAAATSSTRSRFRRFPGPCRSLPTPGAGSTSARRCSSSS